MLLTVLDLAQLVDGSALVPGHEEQGLEGLLVGLGHCGLHLGCLAHTQANGALRVNQGFRTSALDLSVCAAWIMMHLRGTDMGYGLVQCAANHINADMQA